MESKRCFFIGHRESDESILPQLLDAVHRHICEFGVNEFVVGQYGGFDRLSASAVIAAKKEYPHIQLYLLLPYHPAERKVDLPDGFDGLIYPDGMEKVPRKVAIIRANRSIITNL